MERSMNISWKEPVLEKNGHGNNLDNPNKVMGITLLIQIRSWE